MNGIHFTAEMRLKNKVFSIICCLLSCWVVGEGNSSATEEFPEEVLSDLIFADGFESGDLHRWSNAVGQAPPFSEGLIAHWTMDESNGGTAHDQSGHGHDGELYGNVQWTEGVIGSGAVDLGDAGWVAIEDPGENWDFDFGGPFTLALWVRPERLGGNQMFISKDNVFEFEMGKSDADRYSLRLANLQQQEGATRLVRGVWQHLAVTWDEETVRYFYNGRSDGLAGYADALPINDTKLTLGARDGGVLALDGGLDDVRIYNGALNGTELEALYQGTHPIRPLLEITQPDGIGDRGDEVLTIRWVDSAPSRDAYISLYYDTDAEGADGTLIAEGLSEDDEEDAYLWDTRDVPRGGYFIYAIIDDGVSEPVVAYSPGSTLIGVQTVFTLMPRTKDVLDNQVVIYRARTIPAGYEDHIYWYADTMHGMAGRSNPERGRGEEFVTAWDLELVGIGDDLFYWFMIHANEAAQGGDVVMGCENCDEEPPEPPVACVPTGCPPATACASGSASVASGGSAVQILIDRGEERYEATDLEIEGRGIPWRHTRVYRSRKSSGTPMGFGWVHNYYDFLYTSEDTTEGDFTDNIIRGFGGPYPGHTDRHDDWLPDPFDRGRYLPPRGFFATLSRDDKGTAADPSDDSFVLIDRDGGRREYNQHVGDGRTFLTLVADRNGNRIELFYEDLSRPSLLTRINDTLGRDVIYEYYPSDDDLPGRADRLAKLIDFTGREVVFDYDAEGNLIEVAGPPVTDTSTGNDFPSGRREKYTYSTGTGIPALDHNLLAVVRPNENEPNHGLPADGTPAYQWTYNAEDRVATHTVGAQGVEGAAGGTLSYTYETDPAPPVDFDPAREGLSVFKTTEVDRAGNVRMYWVDDFGNLVRLDHFTRGLRQGEPTKYTTRRKFDPTSQMPLIVTYPEGNSIVYELDNTALGHRQKGNILREFHDPGPRGGEQAVLEWRYSYDPFYNQRCLVVDPRGTDGAFVPPGAMAPAPHLYATTYVLDYQEGTGALEVLQSIADQLDTNFLALKERVDETQLQVEAALGLPAGSYQVFNHGDLNGDGNTGQLAGNHVRTRGPTVHLLPDSKQAAASGSLEQIIEHFTIYDDFGVKLSEVDEVGNVTDYTYFQASDPNGDGDSSEVSVEQAGRGYLASILRDGRESGFKLRLATENGIELAHLETTFERDPVGNAIAVIDPRGHQELFDYNAYDELIRWTAPEPYGWSREFLYDANGNMIAVRMEDHEPTLLDYRPQLDGEGNLSMNQGPAGVFEDYLQYDILDQVLVQDIDAFGSDPSRLITNYTYDANENLTGITFPEGNRVDRVFDERDLVFRATRGAGSADAATVTFRYDGNGNLVEEIDAEDHNGDGEPESIRSEYDGYDRRVRVIDAVGGVTAMDYDPKNQLVEVATFGVVGGPSPRDDSGDGNVLLSGRRLVYDEAERLYQVDRWLGVAEGTELERSAVLMDGPLSPDDGFVSQRFEYNAADRVTFTVEDDLDATSWIYDGLQRPVRMLDAEDNEVEWVYDGNSNPVEVIEMNRSQHGSVSDEVIKTRMRYDVLNRQTRKEDNVGNVDRYGFDSRGNRVAHEDANGNTSAVKVDGAGRVLEEIHHLRIGGDGSAALDPSQSHDGWIRELYVWDGNSRLKAVVDDNGNKTTYGYDSLNRRSSATFGIVVAPALADHQPPPTTETWVYDRDDNPVLFRDQNGTEHRRIYDALNRRIRNDVEYAPGNPHQLMGTTVQSFDYDGLSRRTACFDNNEPDLAEDDARCSKAYDSLSRILEEGISIGTSPKRVVSHNYDESSPGAGDGQPTALVYPDGRALTFTYDDVNRIVEIADEGFEPIVTYEYIGREHRVLRKVFQNGVVKQLTHDGIRRPMLMDTAGRERIVGLAYGYDSEDNILFEEKLHSPNTSEVYGYDSAYRLTRFVRGTLNGTRDGVAVPTQTLGALQSRQWTLDGVHNWDQTFSAYQGAPSQVQTRTDSSVNEIGSVQNAGEPPVVPIYDENGNPSNSGEFHFVWDAIDRLRAAYRRSDGARVGAYAYDCNNRRVRKSVTSSDELNGITDFYYAGWRMIEERGQNGTSGAFNRQYVWGANHLDELLTQDDRQSAAVSHLNDGLGRDRIFHHGNLQHSILATTQEDGEVVERSFYDPYGSHVTVELGAPSEVRPSLRFRYTGQQYDPETGLHYFKNRMFSSSTGTFLSRDYLGYLDGKGLYSSYFVVNSMDPLGLSRDEEDETSFLSTVQSLVATVSNDLILYGGVVNSEQILNGATCVRQCNAAFGGVLSALEDESPREFLESTAFNSLVAGGASGLATALSGATGVVSSATSATVTGGYYALYGYVAVQVGEVGYAVGEFGGNAIAATPEVENFIDDHIETLAPIFGWFDQNDLF